MYIFITSKYLKAYRITLYIYIYIYINKYIYVYINVKKHEKYSTWHLRNWPYYAWLVDRNKCILIWQHSRAVCSVEYFTQQVVENFTDKRVWPKAPKKLKSYWFRPQSSLHTSWQTYSTIYCDLWNVHALYLLYNYIRLLQV